MAAVSTGKVAFAGFGLMAGKPAMIVAWIVAYLLLSVLSGIGIVVLFADQMQSLQAMAEGGQSADPSQALETFGQLAPFYAVALIIMILFYAVLSASAYRAILRPSDGAPIHMGFGADEIRQILLMLVMLLVWIGVCVVIGIAVALVGGGLTMALGSAGNGVGAAIGGLLTFVLIVSAFSYVGVKFSLVGPATFAEKGLRVFKSWSLTNGNFWPLFGAYFLLFVMLFVIYLVFIGIIVAVFAGSGFSPEAMQAMQPDVSSIGAYFSVQQIVLTVVGAVVGSLIYAMVLAPGAEAYRQITGGDPAREFE
jgi:hypothetical protein